MRRPSLQFYPADWQANPKLRRCSHAEKGVWLDVICVLHDQDEYGVVRWPLCDLALAVHARVSVLQKLVDKDVLKGADQGSSCTAFIYTPRHGRRDGSPIELIKAQEGPIWYSSRMVRDEYVRQVRADNEASPKVSPKVSPKPPIGEAFDPQLRLHPSRAGVSSSSSSSSSKKERPAKKQQDERAHHPAIEAVREVKGSFPTKDVWDLIINKVGDRPDVPKIRECWLAWRARGYAPTNLGWLVDWYLNGIPGENNGIRREGFNNRNAPASDFEFKPKSIIR